MKTYIKKHLPKIIVGFGVKSPSLATLIIMAATVAFSAQPVLAAKHAAKVIYSFGEVNADSKSGSRGLKKGDKVFSGETVSTARGRAQIKFTDGGFASLQPNTDYEINDYKFEGKADGKERSFLSLLKGSVRLVTGIIGKANRKNFRIKTAVATIGIRGTQGTLTHNDITNITTLQGHGGEWDLESGSFFGPVPAGQSFSCNGVSCASVAGTKTRTEVSRGRGRKSERKRAYQQGQQSDSEGGNCDLGGACDESGVKIKQAGAVASTADDGEVISGSTESLEGTGVVTGSDGKPVALVSDRKIDGDRTVNIVTTDIDSVLLALDSVGGSDDSDNPESSDDSGDEFVDGARDFINEDLKSDLLTALASNRATVAEKDFGTTADGLITYGRWVNGNLLIAQKNLVTGEITQRIDRLRNFKSYQFIFGDELESISFTGTGVYSLTGATYPTAIDGSSMGMRPTSGSLTWNFASGAGSILLPVNFDDILFTISGSIIASNNGDEVDPTSGVFFESNSVMANYLAGGLSLSAYASLNGFFTGENGTSAPRAAAVAYEVDYSLNPFVGVAAFGLSGISAFMPTTTIKYSLQFFDGSGMALGSLANGDDQFAMGTPLSGFTTTFGDTFAQAGATVAESGSNAPYGVAWSRFTSGYSFTSGALPPTPMLTEPFHAISTSYTTPDSVITNATGTATYTLAGATSPTFIYDAGSFTFTPSQGTLTSATFSANFTTGMMDSISYAGTLPNPGSFGLASTGAVPFNSGSSPLTGTVTAASVPCAPCIVTGLSQFGFASTSAGGPPGAVISSFHANGSSVNGDLRINGVALSTGTAP